MKEVLSSMSAGKIWRDAMDTAIDYLQLPVEEFTRPGGLVDAQVCGDAGISGCRSDIFPVERAPNSPRVNVSANGVIPANGPAPTPGPAAPQAAATPAAAPTTGPADGSPGQPTTAPGPQEGQPAQNAQPTPPPSDRPAILPSGPIIAPQRPSAPPPQATPVPKPQQPAPQPTAAPTAKPQNSQPTAAPKPSQNQVQPTTRTGAQPTPKPR